MDKQTFGTLIMDNEQKLYRVAKSILKNDDDCADAAQEAVLKGFTSLHTLKNDRYAMTWLIRILINECYSILRERARVLPMDMEANGGMTAGIPEGRCRYSELYEAMSRLPCDLRVALVLFYLDGYTIKEIAAIMELPSGTVKSRLFRGREQLRMLLQEDEFNSLFN